MEPASLFEALEKRFLEEGHPAGLTLTHSAGIGDKDCGGISRFAHEGMIKRVVGGHWGWSPKMQQMANENRIEAYNFPQGRVTEHRIKLTLYKIDQVMNGDIEEIIDALTAADQAEKLSRMEKEEV